MIRTRFKTLLCVFFWVMNIVSVSTNAQDNEVITIDDTVVGNQEQPKVLYIVPWKSATDATILSLPIKTKMTDVFDHVDRSEHQRHVQFLESLNGLDEKDFLEGLE